MTLYLEGCEVELLFEMLETREPHRADDEVDDEWFQIVLELEGRHYRLIG
jgi:hypothetical protein